VFIDAIIAWLQAFNAWLDSLLLLVISWVQILGPIGVFLGVMIETFIAPIPSPIIMMAAGFLLTWGLDPGMAILSILVNVMLVGAFAVTLGSLFGYGIAYFGGYPIIDRYGKYLGTSIEEIEYMRKQMEESSRDEIYLFTARAVPIIPLSVISIVAGAIRMDIKRFTLVTFLGALPRCLILGLAGWLLGIGFIGLGEMIDLLETIIILLLIIFFVVFILFRWIVRRRAREASQDETSSEVDEVDS
jgi:membrane protein DedA with SNARE-associated domain